MTNNPRDLAMRRQLARQWVQSAAHDNGLLSGIFLISCRHMARVQYHHAYSTEALRYKLNCMRMLSLAISSERDSIADMTIFKTLALACDSVSRPAPPGHPPTSPSLSAGKGEPLTGSLRPISSLWRPTSKPRRATCKEPRKWFSCGEALPSSAWTAS